MKKYLRVVLFLVFFGLSSSTVLAATPVVTTESKNASSVGKYQKFESTFNISKSYPSGSFLPYYYYDPADTPQAFPGRNSPYGVDGISIDVHFRSPSGKDLVTPAFYFQDYVRSGDTMTPTSNYSWKVRFAPKEVGTYTYYLTIQDKEGSTRFPTTGTLNFQSVASNSKGFIRVSPRDTRFFEFENGSSFVPNSSGRQFWRNGQRSSYYEQSFAEFAQYGVNFTRIWDQNDGYGLTVEGHFDAYAWPADYKPDTDAIAAALPKGTQMNQRGNYDEDKIFESAEQNGVYIELSSKGEPYWIWDASIYDEGWNPNPRTWSDTEHLNYWKRNYRYRIARWGYSSAIATWEVWNEHGHIGSGSDVWNFYVELSQYIKNTDPFDHLVTTSQGSQAWSPGFWSSSTTGMDVANYHDYMMSSRYSADLAFDAANFVYRFAQCLRQTSTSSCGLSLGDGSTWQGSSKPIIWGELDTSGTEWNVANIKPKGTHDMRWAGLFSPIGTTGIDWFWDQQSASFIATKHAEAKIASDFFKTIDYAGKNFSYLSTSDVRLTSTVITPSNANLRVLAMKAANNSEAYAWVQNKANERWDQSVNTTSLSATFAIPGMTAGSYSIEIWDTYSGTKTSGGTVTASNGNVTVAVNNLSKDVAIKIISTSNPAPTSTPVVIPTATPVTCKGDINGDSVVDLSDYSLLVQNFLKSPLTNPKADFNGDGIVDLTDYSTLVSRFLKPCSP